MYIMFNEQNIMNACCEFISREKDCDISTIVVDLRFEANNHASNMFFAEITYQSFFRTHSHIMSQQELVDAVIQYLEINHSFIPNFFNVGFEFNEENGIIANIEEN
jgi:hypothetical protein